MPWWNKKKQEEPQTVGTISAEYNGYDTSDSGVHKASSYGFSRTSGSYAKSTTLCIGDIVRPEQGLVLGMGNTGYSIWMPNGKLEPINLPPLDETSKNMSPSQYQAHMEQISAVTSAGTISQKILSALKTMMFQAVAKFYEVAPYYLIPASAEEEEIERRAIYGMVSNQIINNKAKVEEKERRLGLVKTQLQKLLTNIKNNYPILSEVPPFMTTNNGVSQQHQQQQQQWYSQNGPYSNSEVEAIKERWMQQRSQALESFIQSASHNPDIHYFLGSMFDATRNLEKARTEYSGFMKAMEDIENTLHMSDDVDASKKLMDIIVKYMERHRNIKIDDKGGDSEEKYAETLQKYKDLKESLVNMKQQFDDSITESQLMNGIMTGSSASLAGIASAKQEERDTRMNASEISNALMSILKETDPMLFAYTGQPGMSDGGSSSNFRNGNNGNNNNNYNGSGGSPGSAQYYQTSTQGVSQEQQQQHQNLLSQMQMLGIPSSALPTQIPPPSPQPSHQSTSVLLQMAPPVPKTKPGEDLRETNGGSSSSKPTKSILRTPVTIDVKGRNHVSFSGVNNSRDDVDEK